MLLRAQRRFDVLEDEEFDKGLQRLLDKDQAKQYRQWRDDGVQAAEARRMGPR